MVDSNWVMMVELEKKKNDGFQVTDESPKKGAEDQVRLSDGAESLDEEERAALQMIEELLNKI